MSAGYQHLFVNLVTSAAMSTAAVQLGMSPEICTGVILGGTMGCLISPDYDLKNSLPKRVSSTVPLWASVWLPYTKFTKHRGTISHTPILSTAIRCAYFLLLISPVILLLWFCGITFNFSGMYLAAFIAWSIQDITHLTMDGVLFKWLK